MSIPKWFHCTLLITLVLAECAYFLKGDKKLSREMKWQKHMYRLRNFKCEIPRPEVIQAIKFFNKSVKYLERHYIIPSKTVLHRCGSSGCCTFDRQCLPVKTRSVNLWFAVVPKANKNERKRKHRYIKVAAVNHTQCACLFDNNLPK